MPREFTKEIVTFFDTKSTTFLKAVTIQTGSISKKVQ